MVRACVKEPPYFFTQKAAYISASRQDIKNLIGKFKAIHVRNMHANFQTCSFTDMAGKWGDRGVDGHAIFGANRNDFSKLPPSVR